MSTSESRARAKQQWIDEAIRVLRDNDYVVIPRERHRVLTVEKAVSTGLLENLTETDSFQDHLDGVAAREIGYGLKDLGAITKEAFGPDPDYRIYRWRYQAGAILPKP